MTAPRAQRTTPHPLRVAIVEAGWPSITAFAEHIGIARNPLVAVMNGRLSPYPKLRRLCSEALGQPEEALFPDGFRTWRVEPIADEVPA